MKNIKTYLIALIGIAFFSSCSDVENEIWINKDGSGKLEVKYDMSSMLEMASMFEGMGEENSEGTEENQNKSLEKDRDNLDDIKSFDDVMNKLSDPNSMEDIDTTFNLYAVMPDSIKNEMKHPETFKKVNIDVLSNKAESVAKFALKLEYDSYDELTQMFESLSELDKDKDAAEKEKSLDKLKGMMTTYVADLKNGIITIPEQDFADGFLDEGITGGKSMDDIDMDGEDMGMLQMLFGDASIVTKMHLPGEIISCDDPTADIFGDQIRFKDSFMDLMKNKKTKGRVIKFKK